MALIKVLVVSRHKHQILFRYLGRYLNITERLIILINNVYMSLGILLKISKLDTSDNQGRNII